MFTSFISRMETRGKPYGKFVVQLTGRKSLQAIRYDDPTRTCPPRFCESSAKSAPFALNVIDYPRSVSL